MMNRIYVMELVRSFQVGEMSRREFLKRAGVALGSVAAANSLLAACAQTPNDNPPPVVDESQPAVEPGLDSAGELTTGIVDYPDTDDETLMGYLAHPSGAEALPAVVVIQEWWGLTEHIKDVTRRFANEGFVALAPDLYHGVVATEPDEARKLAMELSMPEAVKEIQQAVTFLQEQDNVASDKVGIVGFCMGGRLVLQTALQEDDLSAGVVYYGSPLSREDARQVKAPILSFVGTEDRIKVSDVKAMHTAFDRVDLANEYHVYKGAQHAFFNDTRTNSYNSEAAADSWPRTLEWFRKHQTI